MILVWVSFQLLDCFTIPVVLFLSWIFLVARYRWLHFGGVALCLLGVGALVLADVLVGKNSSEGKYPPHNGSSPQKLIHSFFLQRPTSFSEIFWSLLERLCTVSPMWDRRWPSAVLIGQNSWGWLGCLAASSTAFSCRASCLHPEPSAPPNVHPFQCLFLFQRPFGKARSCLSGFLFLPNR